MKKLFSILSVAFFAIVLFAMNTVNASAADPTTYIIKYDAAKETWYYQVGSSWDDTVPPPKREMYYMLQELKDGDFVVMDATEGWCKLEIDFHLGNVTLLPGSKVVLTCKSVEECFVLADSGLSLYAPVERCWIYDNTAVNLNEGVNNLELIYDDNPDMTVCVVGKCNDFYVHNNTDTRHHLWSFTSGLYYKEGQLTADANTYSINPPSTPPAPIVTPTPSTPTPSAPSADDEYDDVPKTGESLAYLWLFAAAALCLAGSYSMKKKEN